MEDGTAKNTIFPKTCKMFSHFSLCATISDIECTKPTKKDLGLI